MQPLQSSSMYAATILDIIYSICLCLQYDTAGTTIATGSA